MRKDQAVGPHEEVYLHHVHLLAHILVPEAHLVCLHLEVVAIQFHQGVHLFHLHHLEVVVMQPHQGLLQLTQRQHKEIQT